jgi:hypothetical protein
MYSETLHNPKAQKLHPTTFKHWVNLLCLASENETRGVLPDVEGIAFALRVKPVEAQRVIDTLTKAGLLDTSNDGQLSVHNWTARQREFDDASTRVRRHRANRKNSSAENKELTDAGNVTDTLLKRTVDTEADTEKEQRIKDSIESFSISDELRAWARLNTPHVNIPALTERWRKTVRDHHYRNANGFIEDPALSWKTAMSDAERREAKRDATADEPDGLATKHGLRYFEAGKMHQMRPAVAAGQNSPMLSVRSNG